MVSNNINYILEKCLAALLTMICLFFLSFNANCQDISINNEMSSQIDSLIEKQIINKNCILISFGADAITAINTRKGLVVIDAGISTGLTARYRKIIEKEFQKRNFIYLINSHGHPDHYGGNSVFSEAKFVSHINSLKEISGQLNKVDNRINNLRKIVDNYELKMQNLQEGSKEWNEIFTQKIRYLNAYNDAKNPNPVKCGDIVFTDSLNIEIEDISIEMFYFGESHSKSDILIYIPQMEILFTGDLISKYGRPGFDETSLIDKDRCLLGIRWIEKRLHKIKKIISGHGEILSNEDLNYFNNTIKAECSKR